MALRSDRVVMPGGRVATREILEHPGAVAIVALDDSGRVMMLHQYRHAVRRRLWELPAGLLDVAGEDPSVTAGRELAEEAGLAAQDWSVLLDVVPSPGFSDESVRVYLARDVSEVGRPDLGDDEEADLELRWVPLADAVQMVFTGEIVNAVSVSGVLATQAVRAGDADPRPVDAPWPDRPDRFAMRRDGD
ncbi:NUDIX hydrolase [Pseudonocardia sp. KRD-291]|nr:NUDIX hydrolase [Pseudonocardia sp. KRD291]